MPAFRQRNFILRWATVNGETHNWSNRCLWSAQPWSDVYNVLSKAKEHCGRGDKRMYKSWRRGRRAVNCCPLGMAGPLYSGTHGSCGHLHNSCLKSSQSTFHQECRRHPRLLAANCCWGRGSCFSTVMQPLVSCLGSSKSLLTRADASNPY